MPRQHNKLNEFDTCTTHSDLGAGACVSIHELPFVFLQFGSVAPSRRALEVSLLRNVAKGYPRSEWGGGGG